jgi:L-ribulose-5-phosphate 3-epimerase
MTDIGFMQGRMVAPEPGRIQAFPKAGWASEFGLAAVVPLSYVEWIHDLHGQEANPLLNDHGVRALQALALQHNLPLRAICADWFMDFPFLRCTKDENKLRRDALCRLFNRAQSVNAMRIVLPLVDDARIVCGKDEDIIIETIQSVYSEMECSGVELHLESDLPPAPFARLLNRLKHPMVKVNYDSGNSGALGFNVSEEFAEYGARIGSVHIKDRLKGGKSVPLGTGDVDFQRFFSELEIIRYSGDFTLQAARVNAGQEVDLARSNLAFIRRYWTY